MCSEAAIMALSMNPFSPRWCLNKSRENKQYWRDRRSGSRSSFLKRLGEYIAEGNHAKNTNQGLNNYNNGTM